MSPSNIAASVRQRLLNRARQQKRPFNELLQYYAMERFLYRLSQSAHAERFILKGALMLRVWQAPEARPTMDIDMLGQTDNQPQAIVRQITDVFNTPVADDGVVFNADTLNAEIIKEDADYQGVRLRFTGELAGARIPMQLDIGFGDAMVPAPQRNTYPTLLDLPAPELWCYSRESAIAEKFEAMVKLGELNSRMKDFYDIWLLARQFDFSAEVLAEAVKQTFTTRGTALPRALPFNTDFIALKQPQWQAFTKRLNAPGVPTQLAEVCSVLADFLGLLLEPQPAAAQLKQQHWRAPGPWRHR
ncbi:nucleotidyl transferase AbiEii/AbiGii toxin family protein [Gilvimarinus sp. 1_MG-2023]|uniref:nucleotidyl transferase AbiEii/AbiGii toxin family protein n=1 Tax=Gilvimarinus sp. 1_MG-2023 TaxID=3062638 RepID=UPI0026E166EB|nr:nucleotidyl transferase AbiEii/AbiGii toxin family protein [Gilvimarinus sp. 1_MG-2023]MDO6746704.1 nucleotidyl transferase AbiEii/AbiGii toxin family protein [Gilvimarinus sp. 1_MG-2023]